MGNTPDNLNQRLSLFTIRATGPKKERLSVCDGTTDGLGDTEIGHFIEQLCSFRWDSANCHDCH